MAFTQLQSAVIFAHLPSGIYLQSLMGGQNKNSKTLSDTGPTLHIPPSSSSNTITVVTGPFSAQSIILYSGPSFFDPSGRGNRSAGTLCFGKPLPGGDGFVSFWRAWLCVRSSKKVNGRGHARRHHYHCPVHRPGFGTLVTFFLPDKPGQL